MSTGEWFALINSLIGVAWIVLPIVMGIVWMFCAIIDRNENSFKYPNPMILPWIDICREGRDRSFSPGGWVIGIILSLIVCNIITALLIFFPSGTTWTVLTVLGIVAFTMGIRWLMDQKKRPQKVMDRLAGTEEQ